ncbi:uncharacterized protein LOC144724225 isoform X2 [Lampetra planeri]
MAGCAGHPTPSSEATQGVVVSCRVACTGSTRRGRGERGQGPPRNPGRCGTSGREGVPGTEGTSRGPGVKGRPRDDGGAGPRGSGGAQGAGGAPGPPRIPGSFRAARARGSSWDPGVKGRERLQKEGLTRNSRSAGRAGPPRSGRSGGPPRVQGHAGPGWQRGDPRTFRIPGTPGSGGRGGRRGDPGARGGAGRGGAHGGEGTHGAQGAHGWYWRSWYRWSQGTAGRCRVSGSARVTGAAGFTRNVWKKEPHVFATKCPEGRVPLPCKCRPLSRLSAPAVTRGCRAGRSYRVHPCQGEKGIRGQRGDRGPSGPPGPPGPPGPAGPSTGLGHHRPGATARPSWEWPEDWPLWGPPWAPGEATRSGAGEPAGATSAPGPPGLVGEHPPATCHELQLCRPGLADGHYWIDPNQGCPLDALLARCHFSAGGATCVGGVGGAAASQRAPPYPGLGTVQLKFLRLRSGRAWQHVRATTRGGGTGGAEGGEEEVEEGPTLVGDDGTEIGPGHDAYRVLRRDCTQAATRDEVCVLHLVVSTSSTESLPIRAMPLRGPRRWGVALSLGPLCFL